MNVIHVYTDNVCWYCLYKRQESGTGVGYLLEATDLTFGQIWELV